MRAIRLTVAVLIVLIGGGASLGARQKPNFTGHWIIVGSAKGPAREQVVTVDEKTLTTARPDGTRKTIYQLDGLERRMALPSADVTVLASAKWDGNRIVITTTTSYDNGMRTVGKDVWSIDAQGRLVIDYTETGPGAPPQIQKFLFTRKGA
jgi:hypothetical protein